MQQLLHICSEHYEAKEKEKEEDKDKKDKKDKDKKETAADMGSHQVMTDLLPRLYSKHQLFPIISLYSRLYYGCLWSFVFFHFSSQGVAVLGIALIAMGEEIGSEMALRTFGHLVSSTA